MSVSDCAPRPSAARANPMLVHRGCRLSSRTRRYGDAGPSHPRSRVHGPEDGNARLRDLSRWWARWLSPPMNHPTASRRRCSPIAIGGNYWSAQIEGRAPRSGRSDRPGAEFSVRHHDLPQLTLGYSSDEVSGFLPHYLGGGSSDDPSSDRPVGSSTRETLSTRSFGAPASSSVSAASRRDPAGVLLRGLRARLVSCSPFASGRAVAGAIAPEEAAQQEKVGES